MWSSLNRRRIAGSPRPLPARGGKGSGDVRGKGSAPRRRSARFPALLGLRSGIEDPLQRVGAVLDDAAAATLLLRLVAGRLEQGLVVGDDHFQGDDVTSEFHWTGLLSARSPRRRGAGGGSIQAASFNSSPAVRS